MIKSLEIRNYALIESLRLEFADGLTIITGETGAGKSILLGALGLVMGKRADTKALYDFSEKCIVEALFDVSAYDLAGYFEAHDLDYAAEVVIRREILPSGKSRAFVNDTPATLPVVQQLSGVLIDLHQQFDALDMHEVSFQLRVLDALAGNKDLLKAYQERYQAFERDRRQLEELKARDARMASEADFLQFQRDELREAQLQAGEQEELEAEQERLANAQEIRQALAGAYQQLVERELSTLDQLDELGQVLSPLEKLGGELRELAERFHGLRLELRDLAGELECQAERTELDPERLAEVQARLDLLYRLQKKHQVTSAEELLNVQAELEGKLKDMGDLSGRIAQLEARLQKEESVLQQQAEALHRRRAARIPDFESEVEGFLALLAMEHARLEVRLQERGDLGPTGTDEVHFYFSANKGGRLQLIKDVASGGELSRLTLVTKSLVADAIPLPTLIFDEIDTGVSGDVALKMGNILRALSDKHQVVSITHSPQIASKADVHYFVFKEVGEDRTFTRIKRLDREERIHSIATMLSQNPPTESAIENAKELLSI
jgi:DNA repair protein RecN (Recombination protein N)